MNTQPSFLVHGSARRSGRGWRATASIGILAILAALSPGCTNHSSSDPRIFRFQGQRPHVFAGAPATLTAFFADGAGRIDQGVGSVASGVPVRTVPLTAETTFTLNVTNAAGNTATARATVGIATLSVLAGVPGGRGSADGRGSAARFYGPGPLARDRSGNLYVVDEYNRTIRKITPDGVVSTLAGRAGYSGLEDGVGASARFNYPQGVGVDGANIVYVADSGSIRKITPEGAVSAWAGTPGHWGSADGMGAAASFSNPGGIAVDGANTVYVADTGNHTIRRITPAGAVSTLAGAVGQPGSDDGQGGAARFNEPAGIAVDGNGDLYVADKEGHTIRKVSSSGLVSTFAGLPGRPGSANGPRASATFNHPDGLSLGADGTLYVADTGNHIIRAIAPTGEVTTLAGVAGWSGSEDGDRDGARFAGPRGVCASASGDVFVGDSWNNTIRRTTPLGQVSTFAGSPSQPGVDEGTGGSARFLFPTGVAVDASGVVYAADIFNIRKITPDGVATRLAGSTYPGADDGPGASATFNQPWSVAVDGSGNVYVADTGNHTIRKITPGGMVSTFAGAAGQAGSADGPALSARFSSPQGVAVDRTGTLYVADTGNGTLRKITPEGLVSTLAGAAGQLGSADGLGAAARFDSPSSLALDASGQLYVADTYSHTIRKVSPAGLVSTLAGKAGVWGSTDGPGASALFFMPNSLTVDALGNVHVADTGNSVIRMITPAGEVSTILGVAGSMGNLPDRQPPMLGLTLGVAVDPVTGALVVSVEGAVLKELF